MARRQPADRRPRDADPEGPALQPRGRRAAAGQRAPAVGLDDLAAEARRIPGVTAADGLTFVDLPPGSLHAGGTTVDRPVRVFAFDPAYQRHHPSIRIASGALAAGHRHPQRRGRPRARHGARRPRSPSTCRAARRRSPSLSAASPTSRGPPRSSAAASRASSRTSSTCRTRSIVSPSTFATSILPAFQAATAQEGSVLKTFPVQELDVQVDRSRLRSDPGRALHQTQRIADSLTAIAPGQDYLIDNISNALAVARDDAAVGKRMFIFLGLPGVVLAAFLAAYAGHILASTQRREQANLRLRGADRRQLGRVVGAQALAVADRRLAGRHRARVWPRSPSSSAGTPCSRRRPASWPSPASSRSSWASWPSAWRSSSPGGGRCAARSRTSGASSRSTRRRPGAAGGSTSSSSSWPWWPAASPWPSGPSTRRPAPSRSGRRCRSPPTSCSPRSWRGWAARCCRCGCSSWPAAGCPCPRRRGSARPCAASSPAACAAARGRSAPRWPASGSWSRSASTSPCSPRPTTPPRRPTPGTSSARTCASRRAC